MKHIEIVGIDCHIGSQLTKTSPFKDAIARLGELARTLVNEGVSIRYVDIGGGLGIPYNQEDPPSPAEYGEAIEDAMAAFSGLDVTLICEPGRVIVGNAGVLVTETLYLKQGEIKNFVIVDAAMNDLIRPAFYDSYHADLAGQEAARAAVLRRRRRRADLRDRRLPGARSRAGAEARRGRPAGAHVGGRVRLYDVLELQHAAARGRGHGQGRRVRGGAAARGARGAGARTRRSAVRRVAPAITTSPWRG